jgi:hypothetical protein
MNFLISLLFLQAAIGTDFNRAVDMDLNVHEDRVAVCQYAIIQHQKGNTDWLERASAHMPARDRLWLKIGCRLYAQGIVDGAKAVGPSLDNKLTILSKGE